jgi:hypothetical protein
VQHGVNLGTRLRRRRRRWARWAGQVQRWGKARGDQATCVWGGVEGPAGAQPAAALGPSTGSSSGLGGQGGSGRAPHRARAERARRFPRAHLHQLRAQQRGDALQGDAGGVQQGRPCWLQHGIARRAAAGVQVERGHHLLLHQRQLVNVQVQLGQGLGSCPGLLPRFVRSACQAARARLGLRAQPEGRVGRRQPVRRLRGWTTCCLARLHHMRRVRRHHAELLQLRRRRDPSGT